MKDSQISKRKEPSGRPLGNWTWKSKLYPIVVIHINNPSTWVPEARKSGVQDQSGLPWDYRLRPCSKTKKANKRLLSPTPKSPPAFLAAGLFSSCHRGSHHCHTSPCSPSHSQAMPGSCLDLWASHIFLIKLTCLIDFVIETHQCSLSYTYCIHIFSNICLLFSWNFFLFTSYKISVTLNYKFLWQFLGIYV